MTGGATVVFTGIPELRHAPLLAWPLRDVADALGDTLNLVQRRIAQRQPHARYIDVRAGVGDMVRRLGRDLFAADRYHPNPAGYALIAEGIARPLAALIRAEVPVAVEGRPAATVTAVDDASAA